MKSSIILAIYFLSLLCSFKILAGNFQSEVHSDKKMNELALKRQEILKYLNTGLKKNSFQNEYQVAQLFNRVSLIELFLTQKISEKEFDMAFSGLDGDPY